MLEGGWKKIQTWWVQAIREHARNSEKGPTERDSAWEERCCPGGSPGDLRTMELVLGGQRKKLENGTTASSRVRTGARQR